MSKEELIKLSKVMELCRRWGRYSTTPNLLDFAQTGMYDPSVKYEYLNEIASCNPQARHLKNGVKELKKYFESKL